jgi:hypothetical protein
MPPECDSYSDQGAIAQFQRNVVVLKSLIAATLALLIVVGVMIIRVVAFLR